MTYTYRTDAAHSEQSTQLSPITNGGMSPALLRASAHDAAQLDGSVRQRYREG
jgi:hypothetical protein